MKKEASLDLRIHGEMSRYPRIHHAQHALIAATHQIAYHGSARLMHIVRAADDDDAL